MHTLNQTIGKVLNTIVRINYAETITAQVTALANACDVEVARWLRTVETLERDNFGSELLENAREMHRFEAALAGHLRAAADVLNDRATVSRTTYEQYHAPRARRIARTDEA